MNIYSISDIIAKMYEKTKYSIIQHDEGYYLEIKGKRSWSVVTETSMTDEMNKQAKGETPFLVTRFISAHGKTISYSFSCPSVVTEGALCQFTIQVDEEKGTFRHVRQEFFTKEGAVMTLPSRDYERMKPFYEGAEHVLTEDRRYRLAYVTGAFTKTINGEIPWN